MSEDKDIGHVLQNRIDLVLDKVARLVPTDLTNEIDSDLRGIRDEIPCSCDSEEDSSNESSLFYNLRAKARDLRHEAQYYEAYEPDNKEDAQRLYDEAEKLELRAMAVTTKSDTTSRYWFQATGGMDVAKGLKMELSQLGNITGFRLPDGRVGQLAIALEVESADGTGYDYITSEQEMSKLGFSALEYADLHFDR